MTREHIQINIGRQFGSGGHLIGEKLAKELGFPFYDKELITMASKKSGLGKEFFEEADEKTSHSLLGGFLGIRTGILSDSYSDNYLNNETLFRIQSDVIRDLAEKQSCIFVGRCADYILRKNPHAFNLFITAGKNDRIRRVEERQHLHDKIRVEDLLLKVDRKRAKYYNYFTNKTWGAADSYHLCINSSLLGINETVHYILRLIREKFDVQPE